VKHCLKGIVMKQQKNLEAAFVLLKEAVEALRPLSLNGCDDDLALFVQCLKCELSIHKALLDGESHKS
jgi:hypothetical protein